MAEHNLEAVLQQPYIRPVYLFSSVQVQPLREAAAQVLKALTDGQPQSEYTRLDGPAPDMGAVVEAAGTLSLFGSPRVVELREISTTSMPDKDVEELAGLFAQTENAVFVITLLHKDKRAQSTKKTKSLLAAAASAGFVAELVKPNRGENMQYIEGCAKALGARFAPGAAAQLLERAGENRPLLCAETHKLAAMAGYGEITRALVGRYSAHNIEADVFELVRLLTAGNKTAAFAKLEELLSLRHEPIAIAAALSGTFIDMYRVRCGAETGRGVAAVFKQMGYTGNEYRLQKAKENARRYTTSNLEECILALYRLDTALKSSALGEKSILLQAALSQLMMLGQGR